MLGSLLALLGLGFWFGVVILTLLFRHLKRHPDQAAHYTTLFRRLVG